MWRGSRGKNAALAGGGGKGAFGSEGGRHLLQGGTLLAPAQGKTRIVTYNQRISGAASAPPLGLLARSPGRRSPVGLGAFARCCVQAQAFQVCLRVLLVGIKRTFPRGGCPPSRTESGPLLTPIE